MTQWLLIKRLRGPAFLLLIGVMALLHEWGDFGFSRSWPLLLILAGVMSLAERAVVDPAAVLASRRPAPVVLLEDPRDLGNMGACVRVAAAADIAGVLTSGSHDPWHPDALRGAAGLHYAVPVARLEQLDVLAGCDRPLLAVDPGGDPLDPSELPARALLAFGTEREGLSEELAARAEAHVSIPMRPGVSSLNLATSVAAVLFAWRLSARAAPTLA